jgi:hypothetical protein
VAPPPPPALDPVGRDYALLAFGIERHLPGYVDAYVGPPEVRAEALAGEPPEPGWLLDATRELAARVAAADIPGTRAGYLAAQLGAMATTCRRLTGEDFAYEEEVRRCFGVEPAPTPAAVFDAAIADLDAALPGKGSVAERTVAWRRGYEVAPEVARALIDAIVPELRRRTAAFVALPEGEAVEFRLVADEPWTAYNWYLGGARSRVEFNTDLPLHAHRLVGLLCHEAYPGHHAEHALKELHLYRERGHGEHAIQLINTPECVVSEGIATLAEEVVFGLAELAQYSAEAVYPVAGIAGDPEQELAVARAERALLPVAGNAALLLHAEGRDPEEVVAYLERYALVSHEEALQLLRFVADPLWRAYIFSYHAGHDLLGAWLDAGPAGERGPRFRALLTEQVYPAQIASRLVEQRDGTPVE